MMDISRAVRGPIACAGVGGGGGRLLAENEGAEEGGAATAAASGKRKSADDEYVNAKKRRKQLKPIRIATNLDDMVKVPKQIIGLNNDLDDNVNDMSHAVPKDCSSKTGSSSPSPSLAESARGGGDEDEDDDYGLRSSPNGRAETPARDADKPDAPDANVPNLDVGPNYVASPGGYAYPFPFQPVKAPHFWSDANLKIFNQEAYCELCKKEFCNKYFLKTHKANKHGIYVDFPSSGGSSSSTSSAAAAATGKVKPDGRSPENGKSASAGEPDCERAFCELCNKRFCNKYFVRRHKTKSHGLPDEENLYGLSCQDADSIQVQNPTINSTKKSVSIVTTCDSLALIAKENDFDNQKSGRDVQESPLNLIVKDGSEEEGEDDGGDAGDEDKANDGEDCSSENIEKLQTMLMRLNPSEADGRMCKACHEVTEPGVEHRCGGGGDKREYLSEANDSSNESTKTEFPAPKSESHDFLYVSRLDHMKQMKPTSSYCEICNKELCNKYFMRTHMQRMHGIEIEHGTQIGGVVCNICNKELCSKYFLRVHKQNTHGIVSPNSLVGPSTSSGGPAPRVDVKSSRSDPRFVANFSQVCHICNKRFRSPKWLQAHFVSDHRDEVTRPGAAAAPARSDTPEDEDEKEEESVLKIPRKLGHATSEPAADAPEALDVISKLFWENNSSSKSYNCSQCPFTTSVLAFLFVHERSHFVLTQDPSSDAAKPPISLQSLLHDQSFWQHKITQQISECLDLSSGKSKFLSFEQNGS